MRKPVIIALGSLFIAAPAAADIVEFHIGQTAFENEETNYPEVTDDNGKVYRLMATNYVDQNALFRLELRQDELKPTMSGGTILNASRQMIRFGLGERWGSSTFNYGVDLGGAQIKLEQEFSSSSTVEEEEVSPYLGFDLHGKFGQFEWQVDATGYHKVPQLHRYEFISPSAVLIPRDPSQEIWKGAQLVWNFSEGPAIGIRYEISGEIQASSLYLRWEM